MSHHDQAAQIAKHTADAVAGFTALATLMQWLPAAAAFASIMWYGLQAYWAWQDRRNK